MKYFIVILFVPMLLLAAPAEKKYSVILKNWPQDIADKIVSLTPEIKRKDLDASTLNQILKKLDENFNFNGLKLVRADSSNELLLTGEISPEVKKINFEGLSDTTESDALNLMGLNSLNILDEDNLKSGVEKLSQFYRDLGYRSAQVTYKITADSTITRTVTFVVDKKQRTRLSDIRIDGLEPIVVQKKIESYIRKNFRHLTLNQQNLNRISTALRFELSSNGYYLTQVPSPQILFAADELTARAVYKMKNSQRYSVEVTNTHNFEHTNLENDVLKLDTYYSKDENIASDLIEKLKTYYVSEGYPHANVLSYETKKNDKTYLSLSVDEGPFTKIVDFKITGQYSRPESYYKSKFYELSSQKVQDKYFIKDDIEAAAKNLLVFLQNDGYVNAKMSRVFISTDRENPGYGIVVIQIEEGEQVKIGNIQFLGVSSEHLDGVRAAANLHSGESLSLSQLELTIQQVRTYYLNLGYLEYKLKDENTDLVNYYENNTKLDLKFDIEEGPQVKVQSIVTDGNTRTNDKLILIELDFKPGDLLTPAKIDESVSRLQRTGLFNSVEITTLEKDTSVSQRTVVVKITERDPGVRVLGVGLTDENGGTLHGYTGVAYRNFFGWGVGLSARAELNYNFANLRYLEQKYTFGFVWPYIFETRTRFRTSATRSNTIGDTSINKVTESNTAVFSLEQDFTSHFTGLMAYSVSTFKDHGITNEDEIKYGYSSESLVIGSIGPTLDFDYRDNLFNPTKGSFSRVALEYAPDFLGNNNIDAFYRLTAQTTHYFPYRDSGIVFVQSLRGGYIRDIDQAKSAGIPFDKRGFTLGGETTIRGFQSSEFFPSTDEIGASYRLNTSSSYELVKSELRFPISFKYDLAGAVFYDGGRVQIEGLNLIDSWRDAVGIGIRYNTPVGPVNLEYGQKLEKKAGESDGAFYLSVGLF